MVPGTFWYDFLTGPALGGIGALIAALLIGATTLRVSRDRREDAAKDRAAERERTNREEWFRRVQWAQELTRSKDEETHAAGYDVMDHLGKSQLASEDDAMLLLRLTRPEALEVAAPASASTRGDTVYILEDGQATQPEDTQ